MIRRIERAGGAVVFQAYERAAGKKAYVGSYATEQLAKDAIEEHRVTQRRIGRGELAPASSARRTFATGIELWLKALAESGSRSHAEYDSRATQHLLPTSGRMPILEIRKNDVIQWRDKLVRHVSAATVNTILGTLSSAFTWFIGHDWIDQNPCHRVKQIKADARVFPWLQSADAITRLLAELRPNIRTVVAVLVGTGIRLDEALHLRWDDVDLEHRIITVHRGRQGTTKSGKARRVPIFDSVLHVLKEMRLARGASPLLWPGQKPGPPLSQPSARAPFKDGVVMAGLPKALRVHDMRHTFARLFLIDGGDIFKLSRMLGHSSVAITERTYAHLKPDAYEGDDGRVAFRMPSIASVATLRAVQGDMGGADLPRSPQPPGITGGVLPPTRSSCSRSPSSPASSTPR